MKTNRIAALLVFAFASGFAFADGDYERNGFPCVKEVCLGDGMDVLKQIKWEPVKSEFGKDRRANEELATRAMFAYKSFIAPKQTLDKLKVQHSFFDGNRFDASTFDSLNSIQAICSEHTESLRGEYKTASGLLTHVYVDLLANSDASEQTWKVTKIVRFLPTNMNSSQADETLRLFKEKYNGFLYNTRPPLKPTNASYSFGSPVSFVLKFLEPMYLIPGYSEKARALRPLCAKPLKSGLD